MNNSNYNDTDIPVLTDIIGEVDERLASEEMAMVADTEAELLLQIEEEITARITAELSVQIPVLMEAALHEYLPQAIGAKLQAEIMTALASTIPAAAKAATDQLAGKIAIDLTSVLEQRLHAQVRSVVAEEFSRLQQS